MQHSPFWRSSIASVRRLYSALPAGVSEQTSLPSGYTFTAGFGGSLRTRHGMIDFFFFLHIVNFFGSRFFSSELVLIVGSVVWLGEIRLGDVLPRFFTSLGTEAHSL